MLHWIETHGFEVIIAYYFVSSAIGAMPSVKDSDAGWYKFLFAFAHTLAANALRIPQVRALVGQDETK